MPPFKVSARCDHCAPQAIDAGVLVCRGGALRDSGIVPSQHKPRLLRVVKDAACSEAPLIHSYAGSTKRLAQSS